MTQTITITGASGLLGQYLCKYFSKSYNVTALYHSLAPPSVTTDSFPLDLTDETATKKFFTQHQTDFLIHTAGLTSVDACEENPNLAYKLNAQMTANIVHCLNPGQTRLVHISTDHLFSGDKTFYSEESPVNPVNFYAKTKYEAERLAAHSDNTLIIRTNFYGGKTSQKKSFSNWIYEELKNEKQIHLFNDVFFTPLSICSLAENIEKMMCAKLRGIYNVAGTERISKFTFAHMLANYFQLNSELIIQSKIGEASLKAPRPHDMSLSVEKVKKDLPGFIQESLSMGLQKIKSQQLLEI